MGYGNQVPSFSYPGSIILSGIVMLFGSLYLSMPLAIVGIKYDLAWREYDEKQQELARTAPPNALLSEDSTKGRRGVRADGDDETLKALATSHVSGVSLHVGDQFFDIGQRLLDIDSALRGLMQVPLGTGHEAATQRAKQRSELTNRALDAITSVIKLHRRVCTDIRVSLIASETGSASPKKRGSSSSSKLSGRLLSLTSKAGSSGRFDTRSGISKAKSALSALTTRATVKQRVRHSRPEGFRSATWDIFEHNNFSRRTNIVNRVRLIVVVLSIALFYLQTTPELQLTGLRTVLCRRTIKDFCWSHDEPGCYVLAANGSVSDRHVDFRCAIDSDDPNCYGAGFNYGSEAFTASNSSCAEVFGRRGASRVCNNRLCKPSESFMFDMEPFWVYFEFIFGVLFAFEAGLRASVHPVPKMLLHDLALFTDLVVLFPFFVETGSICTGVMPIYSVVPMAPSFLSGVRVLKTLRILKLGTHIPGARVLLKTGELICRRLMIPVHLRVALA